MKKALSMILVLALACSLFAGAALAAASDYVITGESVTVDGTADKTVEVKFISVQAGSFTAFQADWSLKEEENSSYLELSALNSDIAEDAMENDPNTGKTVWANLNLNKPRDNLTVEANSAIWTATYTVDKNTPSGEYTVKLNVISITDEHGNSITDALGTKTATITVTNNSTPPEPPEEGYTVIVGANKTNAAVGETVLVTLDVTNSDSAKTTFNAFDGTLTYNSTVFTYSAADSIRGDFDVDDTSGTLTIRRHGNDVAIPGTSAELTLAFTAAAAGTGTFTLSDVKVSEADAANGDAPTAAVSGTPLAITVSQTYTVTFVGGDDATGPAPALEGGNTVTAGAVITLPANTFTKDGFTFAGWNDGTATYDAGAEYTVNNTVTFTAQWTENAPTPTETASIVSGYLDGYTLIKVTTENATQTPTYDGNVMYKLSGGIYDEDAYYYVVPGTVNAATAQEQLGWSSDAAATLTKTGDANQTGKIDINDAQFIYNLYNGVSVSYTPTVTVAQLLASDVNNDGKVDTNDCAAAIAAIQ